MADEQVYCAEAGGVEGEQKAGMEKFRADYKAKFGMDVQVYAPYVYDAVHVMVKAMQNAKLGRSGQSTCPRSRHQPQGRRPVQSRFDEKGDIKNGALTLFTYKGGQRSEIAVIR
jgi:branched-chain amino acid transport system substrate-binding protein